MNDKPPSTSGAGQTGIFSRVRRAIKGEPWSREEIHDLLQQAESVFDPDGCYRTGDGGYFDADGVLYFKGRLGDMIKTAGANVTPREVELALEELPEVMHAFVLGIPHIDRGEDVAAAVVLRPGAEAGPDELRAAGLPRKPVVVASVRNVMGEFGDPEVVEI